LLDKALISRARDGDVRSLARLITAVENDSAGLPEIMAEIAPYISGAEVIGITGAPGVGKSTTTTAVVTQLRGRGLKVAVLAIDPSSPFSGGALLGDRIRMQEHALDGQVYIRSMATRGHLGGLSAAVPQAIRVLDAAGFDVIVVETVGVGQSEVEIVGHADTTLVLLAPGMGDAVQAAKAGLLEIGDLYIVNKADREGAESTAREIRNALALGEARGPNDWRPRVLLSSADRGVGIDETMRAIDEHRAWLSESGELDRRRSVRVEVEIEQLAMAGVRARIAKTSDLAALAAEVISGRIDPYAAAEKVVEAL
jgi:LAO/AO transport system kinase